MQVELVGDKISRRTIKAPLGLEVHWTVAVTDMRLNSFIAYQTESAVAPVRWDVSFSRWPAPRTMAVREMMTIPDRLIAEAALATLGKPPAEEVHASLKRLKELLENGQVTTTDYALAGKVGS